MAQDPKLQNLTLLEKRRPVKKADPYVGQTALDRSDSLNSAKPALGNQFRRMLKGECAEQPPTKTKKHEFRAILRVHF
jgi:hypothetical protein